ncbi:MAG: YkvA family protein [Candidatus Hodarchaeota archaeon]
MKRGAWKKWASVLKKNTYALYLASRDPRVPLLAKIIIAVVVAYALSPIDLIPDFIPVIGCIDDLLLLPIGIWLVIRLIPQDVWPECHALAQEQAEMPRNHRAAVIIMIIWFLAIVGCVVWVGSLVSGMKSN